MHRVNALALTPQEQAEGPSAVIKEATIQLDGEKASPQENGQAFLGGQGATRGAQASKCGEPRGGCSSQPTRHAEGTFRSE